MHKEIKMMKIGAILPYQFKDEQGLIWDSNGLVLSLHKLWLVGPLH